MNRTGVALSLTWLLALLAMALPAPAHAWSGNGHPTVAAIAESRLTPAARAEVARLLAGESDPTLAGVSRWADRIRDDGSHPLAKTSGPWHYINFADGSCRFDAARDCRGGDCVIGAINRNYLALADAARSDAQRRDALKFLVHLVGDVHQPLHAGVAADRGGTRHQLQVEGRGSNLHAVWDREVLRQDLSPADYAAVLDAQPPLPSDPTLRSQTPALDWAIESCQLTQATGFYPASRSVGQPYADAQRPLAERRLREAGLRLAALLNHALAASAPASAGPGPVATAHEHGAAPAPGRASPPAPASPMVVPLDPEARAALPRREVGGEAHGRMLRCEGVSLVALLRATGAMPPQPLRGADLARYVQVDARDGYRALFSLAELDPTLGATDAWLVDRCDGRALDDDDGPLRLLVPGESRPARWVRQVTAITVIVAP